MLDFYNEKRGGENRWSCGGGTWSKNKEGLFVNMQMDLTMSSCTMHSIGEMKEGRRAQLVSQNILLLPPDLQYMPRPSKSGIRYRSPPFLPSSSVLLHTDPRV